MSEANLLLDVTAEQDRLVTLEIAARLRAEDEEEEVATTPLEKVLRLQAVVPQRQKKDFEVAESCHKVIVAGKKRFKTHRG